MKLTPIQSGTAACLLDALTNKEIARAMGATDSAVEKRIAKLMFRLEARNRVQLALILQKMIWEQA